MSEPLDLEAIRERQEGDPISRALAEARSSRPRSGLEEAWSALYEAIPAGWDIVNIIHAFHLWTVTVGPFTDGALGRYRRQHGGRDSETRREHFQGQGETLPAALADVTERIIVMSGSR